MEDEFKQKAYKWIYDHYMTSLPKDTTLEEFVGSEDIRYDCIIKMLKEYFNSIKKSNEEKHVIDSDITLEFCVDTIKYMGIDFVGNSVPEKRIYILQVVLMCIGYPCDLNGIYSKYTRSKIKQYKREHGLSDYAFSNIDYRFWFNVLGIEVIAKKGEWSKWTCN